MEMRIGKRRIDAEHAPFIIAELSGNHNGSLETALSIVQAAAEAGASAIKLQTFTPDTLTIRSNRPEFTIDDPRSPWHGRVLWELYAQAATPWEWHAPLFSLARARGLACISTAFDESSVRFLVEQQVDALKIASFEAVHIPLIECVASTGLPAIISTGMTSVPELDECVDAFRAAGGRELALLKCTSSYPSVEDDANLGAIARIRDRYGCEVGLSDHTLRPFVALAATALGASLIEKHVTLRRSDGGVDSSFSLEPAELRELAEAVELTWRAVRGGELGPRAVEATSLLERPSIYVIRNVMRGDQFSPENLRIIRPAAGLAPRHWRKVLGRRAAVDVAAGTPLAWPFVDTSTD
jgi:pseudaminic acid synthase